MYASSHFLVFAIIALGMCLGAHARPYGKYPTPENPDKPQKPQRPEGPVQPFAFLKTYGGYLNQAVPVAPAALNRQTILDGPLNQADYPDPADIPDAPDVPDAPDAPDYDAPDAPDAPDYEEYEPPDTPDVGANENPGVFSDGGFGFLGGDQVPFMMTGGKAPSSLGKGVMNEYRKGSSSGSSVGIAFAVLAIIGCTVALGVFFFKKYRHRIPVIVLK